MKELTKHDVGLGYWDILFVDYWVSISFYVLCESDVAEYVCVGIDTQGVSVLVCGI